MIPSPSYPSPSSAQMTPGVIVPTPRLSRKRYATTPPYVASPSCRFIPQRSRMDISQTRASFLSSWSRQQPQQHDDKATSTSSADSGHHHHYHTNDPYLETSSSAISMTKTIQKQNYDRHLKRVLLGRNKNGGLHHHEGEDDMDNSILAFGPSRPVKRPRLAVAAPSSSMRPLDDPYQQDILRNALAPSLSSASSSHHYRQRRGGRLAPPVSIDMAMTLSAPNLHPRFRHLIGYSSKACRLAVALYDKVYLWNKGVVELLAETEGGGPWTCLQWSQEGTQLALGMKGKIMVYDSSASLGGDGMSTTAGYKPIVKITSLPGDVTAMAFQGAEIMAGCENGSILRYNTRIYPGYEQHGTRVAVSTRTDHDSFNVYTCYDPPIEATYQSHRGGHAVTLIQWEGNIIATAGGGTIQLFDSRKKTNNTMGIHHQIMIAPIHVMEHTGVLTLEFCAKQPNLLVSGGFNGLHFWNIWNGHLRGSIALPGHVVTGTLCSTEKHEILVAHGNSFSLWSLATKEGERIMDEPCDHPGNIRTMIRGPNGKIVCIHDDDVVTMHTIRREISKEKARSTTLGLLVMPVVR